MCVECCVSCALRRVSCAVFRFGVKSDVAAPSGDVLDDLKDAVSAFAFPPYTPSLPPLLTHAPRPIYKRWRRCCLALCSASLPARLALLCCVAPPSPKSTPSTVLHIRAPQPPPRAPAFTLASLPDAAPPPPTTHTKCTCIVFVAAHKHNTGQGCHI